MVNGIAGIQILGLLFGLFMIYYTFLHRKRNELGIKEYFFWFIVWIMFIIVVLFPRIIDPLIQGLNFARRLDFFIILGFLFLIGLSFYTYIIVKKNQNQVEEIVRKIALKGKK